MKLGVNVDHVATLRQARLARYPDPLEASLAAQKAGADAITVHLREDRRHIQDRDLFRIREAIGVHLNQEMAPVHEMVEIAIELRPQEVCLVPERREELTTEGGLDAAGLKDRIAPIVERLKMAGIAVSLFIDPEPRQVEAAALMDADFVELHTGAYATLADADLDQNDLAANDGRGRRRSTNRSRNSGRGDSAADRFSEASRAELKKLRDAAKLARELKIKPNAGHGLNYRNVVPIATIPGIAWLHIGHSIVARSVIVGMERAVREMRTLIDRRAQSKLRR